MKSSEQPLAVVGAGVVGCAVAFELARRGAAPLLLLEAEERVGLGASGANSGIVHTGFDSKPGELETELILRAGELRGASGETLLGAPLLRCGARLRARDAEQRAAVGALAANARGNGVEVSEEEGGELVVPGEAVTDPLAALEGLAEVAVAAGARLRTGCHVTRVRRRGEGATVQLAGGEELVARAVVNCAGLGGGELSDDGFEVYPRKGEFLVFAQPADQQLREILLPLPSSAGKGVLVFPTVDGHVIAGPTARDREDRGDWSVEQDASELIVTKACEMFPPLEGVQPLATYAGLRPAGRGFNYMIDFSTEVPAMLHVAAIRSTGLTAAAGIAERVAQLVGERIGLDPEQPSAPWPRLAPRRPGTPWWRLAAARSAGGGSDGDQA